MTSLSLSFFTCQFSSVAQSCPTLGDPTDCSTQGFPVDHQLLELAQIHVHRYHLILCCPLLLLPSIFPSIKVFSNMLALCSRWPKYWSFSFSFSTSPFNEYSGLFSFRINWLKLLAVQGTLKSLLQFDSIDSLLLSLLYSPTHIHTWLLEKPQLWLYECLSAQWYPCFNMLSRYVMAFFPRSKCP